MLSVADCVQFAAVRSIALDEALFGELASGGARMRVDEVILDVFLVHMGVADHTHDMPSRQHGQRVGRLARRRGSGANG